jgi:hypothetical protein
MANQRDIVSFRRPIAALIIAAALCVSVLPHAANATSWPTVKVNGQVTSWRLTLLDLRKMDRIPNTTWKGYGKHIFTFWVLTLRMTNLGHRDASIQGDLSLTLRVLPKYRTYLTPGWTGLDRSSTSDALTEGAAKDFGGALPWSVTRPDTTTTYCLVIGARPGESHYGIYNATFTTGYTLLFDTGM